MDAPLLATLPSPADIAAAAAGLPAPAPPVVSPGLGSQDPPPGPWPPFHPDRAPPGADRAPPPGPAAILGGSRIIRLTGGRSDAPPSAEAEAVAAAAAAVSRAAPAPPASLGGQGAAAWGSPSHGGGLGGVLGLPLPLGPLPFDQSTSFGPPYRGPDSSVLGGGALAFGGGFASAVVSPSPRRVVPFAGPGCGPLAVACEPSELALSLFAPLPAPPLPPPPPPPPPPHVLIAPSPAAVELASALSYAGSLRHASEMRLTSIEVLRAKLRAEEAELREGEAALRAASERVVEARRRFATEAERAHNAEQPIVTLPDVLQKKIIDLLPAGR